MFIKWRKYQRQLNGVKGDKYRLQPIIVRSYRIGIKNMKEWCPNMPADRYDHPEFRKKVFRPRHEEVFKLPSYPACMVVYFRSPHWMGERLQWWQHVDLIFEKLVELQADIFTPTAVAKLKTELELAVPRITPEEEDRLRVVLNDLPLHPKEAS